MSFWGRDPDPDFGERLGALRIGPGKPGRRSAAPLQCGATVWGRVSHEER